jgi:type I restriction enzyme, S subunit
MRKAWRSPDLGSLCRLINGRAFKPSDWGSVGLPIVRIQNLNDQNKPFNCYSGKASPNHLIDTGDILLSWSGTPGTSFGCFRWERGPAVVNQHIFKVLVDDSEVDGDFFIHAVNSRLEEMISKAHGGVGLRHITKGKLEAIKLPLPLLPEQRRIVARIRECTERVEEMERLRAEAVKEREAVFPSLLSQVFDELSGLPQEEIGDVALETRYGTSRKCSTVFKGTAILRIPNVINGSINFDDLKYCELDQNELRRVRLENGDLLFVRTNGSRDLVGRCAIFNAKRSAAEYGFASYLIRVRLDQKRIRPEFVAYFLNSTHGRSELNKRRRTSAGQFNINSENLRNIELPVPPIDVQDSLITSFAEQAEEIGKLKEVSEAAIQEERHLRDAILRQAFAGEL